jgi:hypothetical protein
MRVSSEPSPVQIAIHQKQREGEEYFSCFWSMVTNDPRCTCEIKARFAVEKAAFKWNNNLFTSKLDLKKKLVKCYIWSIELYDAENSTFRTADQKYLESFGMLCWRV